MATTATSKNSKKAVGLAKDRPFDPKVLKRAAELALRYQIVIRWDDELDGFAGKCIELPNAIGFGETETACAAEVRGNVEAILAFMIERGEKPPLADEPKRNAQVKVPFADYEKQTAQALADAAGQTLPDYIRTLVLRGT